MIVAKLIMTSGIHYDEALYKNLSNNVRNLLYVYIVKKFLLLCIKLYKSKFYR